MDVPFKLSTINLIRVMAGRCYKRNDYAELIVIILAWGLDSGTSTQEYDMRLCRQAFCISNSSRLKRKLAGLTGSGR